MCCQLDRIHLHYISSFLFFYLKSIIAECAQHLFIPLLNKMFIISSSNSSCSIIIIHVASVKKFN